MHKTFLILLILCSVTMMTTHSQAIPDDDEDEQQMEEEEAFMNMTTTKGMFDFLKRHDCPDIPNVQNFNTDKFLGRWYEKWRSVKLGKKFRECNTMNITKRPDGFLELIATQTQLHRKLKYKCDDE